MTTFKLQFECIAKLKASPRLVHRKGPVDEIKLYNCSLTKGIESSFFEVF